MLERLKHERPAEEEDSRRGPKEGRGSASLVQGEGWTDMMSWTRHAAKAKEKAMEEKENTEAKED